MPVYRAPTEDYRFLLADLLELEKQRDLPQFGELSEDLLTDILSNAGKLCEDILAPINRSGDEEGCHYENGVVRTPAGFKEAYKAYAEGGWSGLGAEAEDGGADMPPVITLAVGEMVAAANAGFSLFPLLTAGAMEALKATGADWMKAHIVPKMVSGEWAGTMNLTEPHAGSDLKLMKTRAIKQDDGTYRITGTKIFISGGEQDLTENIIHLVIAKVPDEHGHIKDDLATVNFFMVPKFLVGEDGKMGARNGVTCGTIEKKMGIKGSPTCVMNFDDAIAWKLSPMKGVTGSSAGMSGMFVMMNGARVAVGVQGLALADVAQQNAVAYAQERRSGRAATGPAEPDKSADPIIVHADVRRMLLHSRSFVEGARALSCWTALNSSIARSNRPSEEKTNAAMLADLMVPVIKSFFTDMGTETANLAVQTYGGHGYIRENGVEQFVRDARITQLYEGTNGIQAMDLVGRKLGRSGGAAPKALFTMLSAWLSANDKDPKDLAAFIMPVGRGADCLYQATQWLAENGTKNPNDAGAAAADYLRLMAIVMIGWMWARMGKLASDKLKTNPSNAAFYENKVTCARYWMERMIPETSMLLERIRAGSGAIMALDPTA